MELNLSMPFKAGDLQAIIYGGPFRKFEKGTRRLVGIKMAEEIDKPHDIAIDTEDFSIPSAEDLYEGMAQGLRLMARGNDLYVGCMGGTGRTGFLLGCFAKLMYDYEKVNVDPVKYVRATYKPHAIETPEQEHAVRTFDTKALCELVASLQPVSAGTLETWQVMAEEAQAETLVADDNSVIWANQAIASESKWGLSEARLSAFSESSLLSRIRQAFYGRLD